MLEAPQEGIDKVVLTTKPGMLEKFKKEASNCTPLRLPQNVLATGCQLSSA